MYYRTSSGPVILNSASPFLETVSEESIQLSMDCNTCQSNSGTTNRGSLLENPGQPMHTSKDRPGDNLELLHAKYDRCGF